MTRVAAVTKGGSVTESLIALVALLVLPVILLFAFAGCVGDDPVLRQQKEEAEKKLAEKEKEQVAQKEAEKAADEAAKYDNIVEAESLLVSYWRLDEEESGGTVATDSAPLPRHGEYKHLQGMNRAQTGALSTKHLNNKAVDFLGTQGYVEVPYDALRNPPLSFTVELWLKPDGASTQPQVVFGSYELDPTGNLVRGFALDVLRGQTLRARGRVAFDGQVTVLEAGLGDGLEHGGWRHVVMTYSGANKRLQLYVNSDDGKPEAELPTPANPGDVKYKAITDQTMPLRIAAGEIVQPPQPIGGGAPQRVGMFFEGRIDEIALYRDALDGTTIKKHFLAAIA